MVVERLQDVGYVQCHRRETTFTAGRRDSILDCEFFHSPISRLPGNEARPFRSQGGLRSVTAYAGGAQGTRGILTFFDEGGFARFDEQTSCDIAEDDQGEFHVECGR